MRNKITRWVYLPLSIASAWSCTACLETAFGLPITQYRFLLLFWSIWALLVTLLSPKRFGPLFMGIVLAGTGGFFWYTGLLPAQGKAFIGLLLKTWRGAYEFTIPEAFAAASGPLDLLAGFAGLTMIYLLGIPGFRGGWLPGIILFLPCLLVTDTVPAMLPLYVWLLCTALLLLSDTPRGESDAQGGKTILYALLPTALALAVLFYALPRSAHTDRTENLRAQMVSYLETLPVKIQTVYSGKDAAAQPAQTLDLSALSDLPDTDTPVAEIITDEGGPVYLRLQDYDIYTGTAWESGLNRQETLAGFGDSRGNVLVKSYGSDLLLPSFPDGEILTVNGRAVRQGGSFASLRREACLGASPDERWLELPEHTKTYAVSLLSTLLTGLSDTDTQAAGIGDFVRNSASYSSNVSTMAGNGDDFAAWFLEKAETGYCTHFATAAAVLLRAAGIPARFVTGYLVETEPGVMVTVTARDAHAWVEYYNYRTWSWYILDATPGDPPELSPLSETEPETEAATEPTQAETQPQTVPTEPVPAAPTQETVPAETPPEPHKEHSMPKGIVLAFAAIISFTAAGIAQRLIRLSLRKKRLAKGNRNAQALLYWQEIRRLCRLCRCTPERTVYALAEKAKFSQHLLTPEELGTLVLAEQTLREKLSKEKWYRRILYRWWYCVL